MFNKFGNYGPILLMILSWVLLWDKIFFYTMGLFISALLNLILKGIFKQLRPGEVKQEKRFIFKNGMPHDIYGMPSGHAQSSLYSTTFIFLMLKSKKWLFIYLLISLIIMAQRVVYNHHTTMQVIVGAIVGVALGYFVYKLSSIK